MSPQAALALLQPLAVPLAVGRGEQTRLVAADPDRFVVWARSPFAEEGIDRVDSCAPLNSVEWDSLTFAGEWSADESDAVIRHAAVLPAWFDMRLVWRAPSMRWVRGVDITRRATAHEQRVELCDSGNAGWLPSLTVTRGSWSVDARVLAEVLQVFGRVRFFRDGARMVLVSDDGEPRESHIGAVVLGQVLP